MRRRTLLSLGGTALAGAFAGCTGLGGDGGGSPTTGEVADDLRNASFEDGWAHWTVGRDLPEDPNRPGEQDVASLLGVTTRDASDGAAACSMYIDGSQDDGTVWVQQPVDLSDYDYLAVDYTVSDSFNHIRNAALYTGPRPDEPLVETDFDTSNSLEGHEAPGWQTVTHDVDHDGPGLVAVGFSVVWETGARALLDDVRLSSEPPATVTPDPPTTDGDDDAGTL